MFPCVVSDQIESNEGKHSLLKTTCNRFFRRPNKSTLCFRSCDTFWCFVLFPTYPVSGPPPPSTSSHSHTHAHAHSEFPFPVRQITWTGNGVLQRNMLGQENRKASSRASSTKRLQSQGETQRSWGPSICRRQGSKKRVIIVLFYFHHTQNASVRLWKIHTTNISQN